MMDLYGDHETVTFSDREWAEMLADPVPFGFSCRGGHRLRESDGGECWTCESVNEAAADLYSGGEPTPAEARAFDRWVRSLEDFRLVKCGKCRNHHVGIGAVKRCHGVA